MKIYFSENKRYSNCGTMQLLRYLISKNNMEVVENANNCDIVFVSLFDITEFSNLRKTYLTFKGKKPVIVGGDVAKLDFVKNYADYICLGEAYHFIEELGKIKNIKEIENIKNVTTKSKEGIIDYDIDYYKNPLIKASKKVIYYYGGKGCPQKCKFCFYSHVNSYSQIPESLVLSALKKIPKSTKLYLTSAYFPFPDMQNCYLKKLGMIDLKIGQYLKRKYPSRSFRMGIEFFKESKRKEMGKPISDEKITEAVNKSLYWNHEITMYLLAGLEKQEDMYKFIECFPEYQKTYSPRITIHFQYIDFNEKTPLEGLNITQRNDFNTDSMQKEFNKKNRRVRVMQIKYKANSTYRTLLQRTKNKEETEFVYSLRNEKNNDVFINKVMKIYPELLGIKENIYV